MKKIAYSVMALFALGIFFSGVGISSSEEFPEGTISLYDQSDLAGWDTLPASGMIGAQLLTPEGDYLGVISDLVVDPNTGHISEVILSDVPGRGGEQEAVPFVALSHTGNGIFVMNLPDIFPVWYRSWDSPLEFRQPTYTHWAELRFYYSVEPTSAESFNVSTLMGAPVETSKEEWVGRVNNLVIDFRNDQVVYLVLSDMGGMGGRMVAVPFNELSKGSGNAFTLHTTKERLMNAPIFAWKEMNDLGYAQSIYRHFGVQPYWEEK